jgi:type II secretory pathway component PulF
MTTQVIPKFAAIYESVHMALPLPTQILMGISGMASGHPLLTLGLAGAVLFHARSSTSPAFLTAPGHRRHSTPGDYGKFRSNVQ